MLRRLTASNIDRLPIGDSGWVCRVRQEHDFFADALRNEGVEVLLLTDLLAESLADEKARAWLLERAVTDSGVGPSIAGPLTDWLATLDPEVLAVHLVGGATLDELPFTARGLRGHTLRPDRVRLRAAAEPDLHPRFLGVDLRRCLPQPHGASRPLP